jgi:hypothetical protein
MAPTGRRTRNKKANLRAFTVLSPFCSFMHPLAFYTSRRARQVIKIRSASDKALKFKYCSQVDDSSTRTVGVT